MGAEGAMCPRALDAHHDASVDDPPLRVLRCTVSTSLVGKVLLQLQQDVLQDREKEAGYRTGKKR